MMKYPEHNLLLNKYHKGENITIDDILNLVVPPMKSLINNISTISSEMDKPIYDECKNIIKSFKSEQIPYAALLTPIYDQKHLEIVSVAGYRGITFKNLKLQNGDGLSSCAYNKKKIIAVGDVNNTALNYHKIETDALEGPEIRSEIAIPLPFTSDENINPLGVLVLSSHITNFFNEKNYDTMFEKDILKKDIMANLEDKLTQYNTDFRKIIDAMYAVDKPFDENHSLRVREYTKYIVINRGWLPEQVFDIELAAMLHDIGKAVVPEEILKKKEALNEEEKRIIHMHTWAGAIILKEAGFKNIAPVVECHHKWYNGAGYPERCLTLPHREGNTSPEASRIISVADAYDVMGSSRRIYNSAKNYDERIAELKRFSGTQFDPKVVKDMLFVLNELNKKD